MYRFTLALVLALCFATNALACPRIGRLFDFNCDRQLRIAFTGDSVVKGVGDELNENNGGYVLRTQERFTRAQIFNLGVSGITTPRLFASYRTLLLKKKEGQTRINTKDSDLIILDVGRNDFYLETPAIDTIANLKKLVRLLRRHIGSDVQSPPLIAVSTLLPTTREFQAPFIAEVNHLLVLNSSGFFPVRLRFDVVDPLLISLDGLHPTSAGYDQMAGIVATYLTQQYPIDVKAFRGDSDADGVYDRFETKRYGTDPTNPDTDEDGLLDGEEIFKILSNPLVVDTDGDGFSDGAEVTAGTDPLVPEVVATPTPTPTETPTVVP